MPILTAEGNAQVERNVRGLNGRGVSWEQAKNSAEIFHASMSGRNFGVDKVPPRVIADAKAHPVRIFNVGPWGQKAHLGTLGVYAIPACPEDKPYVEMTIVDPETGDQVPALNALVFEPLKEDGRFSIRQHEGEEIAMDILGVGPFQNPQNSLIKFGCFRSQCSKDGVPSKQELSDARKALFDYLSAMVSDARIAQRDGKVAEVVGKDHYTAARILKLNPAVEGWMSAKTIEVNETCPGCGTPYKKGIAVCKECRTILDEEKYKTLKRAS